ncbi:YqgE/AlgH family protein [Lichenibacterium minor]|nr:YqgE/AlgH family protein [Lichenibacterium minor]
MTTASPFDSPEATFLDGQLLVAMPGMGDKRFERAVIYLCAHSADGAMGIIINHPAKRVSFTDLLVQLDVIEPDEAIRLPTSAGNVPVVKGGPVDTGRGFVLHSTDYHVDSSTMEIDGGVSLTATVDVLRAIAKGLGPHRAMLALGYAGWEPGQLEQEIRQMGWLHCPADEALIFDPALDTKYDRALRKIGIDPGSLSSQTGHA